MSVIKTREVEEENTIVPDEKELDGFLRKIRQRGLVLFLSKHSDSKKKLTNSVIILCDLKQIN